jgi:catechol 2,3-dioxygenase-like lactoylglutathione lyase family enzyme
MSENPNVPSKVSGVVIGVTDLDKSIDFYHDVLGMEVTSHMGEIATLSAGTVMLVLSVPFGKAIKPAPACMELILPVESVSASHVLLTDRGCKFSREPAEMRPGSWAATFADPDGHILTIFGGK